MAVKVLVVDDEKLIVKMDSSSVLSRMTWKLNAYDGEGST